MIAVQFQSATAYLIDDAPDWTSPVELEAQIPTHKESGLSGREARRPLGDTLRLKLRYSTLLQDLAGFRNALQDLNDKRVLCPLWAYQFDAGTTPIITAPFYALMGDGLTPEIKTDAERPFSRPAYPLLVGQFQEIPEPQLYCDTSATAQINFSESDEWAITPPAYVPPNGLQAAGVTRPLFAWRPNWATLPQSGNSEVEIERREIGERRNTADAYYDQRSRRNVQQGFTLSGDAPWQFLRFFLDLKAKNFWLPAGISDAALTQDVASNHTVLNVDNPNGRGGNTTVLLDDLDNRVPVVVTGTNGNQWQLSAVVGTAFEKRWTRIESLLLARFNTPSVTLRFEHPELASVTLRFLEVPWEVSTPAGEVIGGTMGALPVQAYLYVFTIEYPGSPQVWNFTSFERDLSDGNTNYTSVPIEHGEIKETATIERQATALKSRAFTDHPLALMIPFTLEWPLLLDIYECDVSDGLASNLRRVFAGEVEDADYDGPYIQATIKSLGVLFDRRVPRRLVQPICNWALFEPDCGLNKDDWKWTGAVTAYDASKNQITLGNIGRVSGPAVTLDEDFFEGGYIYFGAGQNQQYRMILSSTALVSGELKLTTGTPLRAAPALGTICTFHPGCNGRFGTCINKFNNGPRFGGFPFMPVGNPSMIKISKGVTSGGKK